GTFLPLKGVRNDLDSMEAALGSRKNFTGIVSSMYGINATRKAVLGMLESCASANTGDSAFVFYFTGHWSEAGLSVHDGEISPQDLYSKLSNIRGKKLVLLDCCHSSVFLHGMPPGTLVISGESPDGSMYEGVVTDNSGATEGFFRQGFLTRSFVKVLEA